MKKLRNFCVGMMVVVAGAAPALADSLKFNFKDPKGVNTITFTMDAPLEAITGSASGISGEVVFDPAKPAATTGKVVVEASSMHVPNPSMKQHMHGKDWMDVENHGSLVFEADSLGKVQTTGDVTDAEITGKLTIKGVTRSITAPVKITYLKDKLAERTNGMMKGDLLVLRSTFTIKRTDFGINPKAPTDKVADEVVLKLSVAGFAPKA